MSDFKVFSAYGAASRPVATLRSSGYVFLSRGIAARAGHESATHYELMFSDENSQLGIRLYTEPDVNPDAPSVRQTISEKSGISLTIVPLLRFYGFPDLGKGKRLLPVTFEQDMIVIDLSQLREGTNEH
jgi:hypothetical protein